MIVDELGLSLKLVRRRVASYTPDPRVGGAHGLLVDDGDAAATAASFARVTGGEDARPRGLGRASTRGPRTSRGGSSPR